MAFSQQKEHLSFEINWVCDPLLPISMEFRASLKSLCQASNVEFFVVMFKPIGMLSTIVEDALIHNQPQIYN